MASSHQRSMAISAESGTATPGRNESAVTDSPDITGKLRGGATGRCPYCLREAGRHRVLTP